MNDKIKAFEKHLKEEEKAENTVNKYLRDIKEFYAWHNNSNIVTKDDLLDYKEHLKKSKLKVSSINSKISSLNAYFTYTENETLKVKVLKCQKSLFGIKEKELTTNELKKLYNAARNDEMLMYGKEASNRKQEIDRQHYTIPNQRPKDKHCGKI